MKRVEGVSWSDALAKRAPLPEIYRRDDPFDVHLSIFEDLGHEGLLTSLHRLSVASAGFCALGGLDPHVAMCMEACLFSLASFNSAIFGDKRLVYAWFVCLVGAALAIVLPEWSWWSVNTTNLLTLIITGVVWHDPKLQAIPFIEDALAAHTEPDGRG